MSEKFTFRRNLFANGLRRVAVASGDNLCPSVGHIFPLIAQIYTDIPCIRANPCSSVVGIISHGGISLCGYVLTTECHWFTLNPGYVSRASVLIRVHPWNNIFPLIALINTDIPCIRANPCSSVVGIIFLRETSFYGYILTTELHWFTLNQGYVSRASVLICVHPWDIYSHWLHWYTLIFRVSVDRLLPIANTNRC